MTTTETRPMTPRQEQVLEFIRQNSGVKGPTVREIALAFSIRSPNGVVCHLKALERKGLIRRTPHSSRGIEVVR